MKYQGCLLAVKDMAVSKDFYENVLHQKEVKLHFLELYQIIFLVLLLSKLYQLDYVVSRIIKLYF